MSNILNLAGADETINQDVQEMERNIGVIKNNILQTQARIQMQDEDIKLRQQALLNKNRQIMGQDREIKKKMELLETRNRQLQLSIDKNIFKKKVIYTLLSIIIAILVLLLIGYGLMNKT